MNRVVARPRHPITTVGVISYTPVRAKDHLIDPVHSIGCGSTPFSTSASDRLLAGTSCPETDHVAMCVISGYQMLLGPLSLILAR